MTRQNYKAMKRFFFLILGVLAFVSVSAQKQDGVPFNCIVENAFGQPLKGAKVWVVSPNYFATSDKMGKFGLTNVMPTDTIHVKFKKRVYDVPVDSKKSIRVRIADELKIEAQEDEELVNIGYGFVKRRESCSATTGIPGEVLVRTGRTNVLEAMQGLVPGLTVSNGRAIIRGIATINSVTDPLYIVDGVEVQSLSFVSVYDVDRVDVLKDANIYGAKGANGAILVTTKLGAKK
jgi:TonB-dependent SusC/RagA subfamily outer membrane receptor